MDTPARKSCLHDAETHDLPAFKALESARILGKQANGQLFNEEITSIFGVHGFGILPLVTDTYVYSIQVFKGLAGDWCVVHEHSLVFRRTGRTDTHPSREVDAVMWIITLVNISLTGGTVISLLRSVGLFEHIVSHLKGADRHMKTAPGTVSPPHSPFN